MPSIQDPNLGMNYGWDLGEDGWKPGTDDNYKLVGAVLHLSIKDKDLTVPPGSPVAGDRYIVGASATGAWAGQDGKVAVYREGAWAFITPKMGWSTWVEDEAQPYVYTTSWGPMLTSQPYDLHCTFNDRPDSSITMLRVVFPRTTTFPAGLTESRAVAEIAATGAVSFPLTKNGASIGSINWGIGATTATFTFATQQVFSAGDVLELTSPASVDPSLADFAITLVGQR